MTRLWLLLVLVLVCAAGCGEDRDTTIYDYGEYRVISGVVDNFSYNRDGDHRNRIDFEDDTFVMAHKIAEQYPVIQCHGDRQTFTIRKVVVYDLADTPQVDLERWEFTSDLIILESDDEDWGAKLDAAVAEDVGRINDLLVEHGLVSP